MNKFPDPVFTPVAESIKANREDERKTLFDGFAASQRSLAYKVLKGKMTHVEIFHLLMGEADHLENKAAELNHV
ncbi:DUF2732 family protein [Providencia sp. PROV032]|uniref:DUF2732 family protein n=1 Tax=Providencia sp. PROV032 TaxID=2949764 RepID=UPI00234B25D2|nr:DUF2732 family protein [Providencia sp. PROV032]